MNGWSDDTERRRFTEPPLPPELSPRRAAATHGGVPPQQTRRPQPGGGPGGYGPPSGGGQDGRGPRGPRWSTRKKIGYTALGLVVVLLVVSVSTYFWADSKVRREVDLSSINKEQGAPAKGKGTNYLIVGSDSREGLSKEQEKELHTGSDSGQRTDSMMILHTGGNGTTMMSLPRDSYVDIPSFYGKETKQQYPASTHKLNKAYADGGPELLARTVEKDTGIHIDHYAEIGFSGFVNLVDALGGVRLCLDAPLKDKASGADLQKGCQKVNGKESLAYVRERHQEADQDLGRMKHQQEFLSTLAHQAASPSTILNPFKLYPVIGSGLDTLVVDKGMSLLDLTHMFFAMKSVSGGNGQQITVPIANANYETKDGDAVLWDKTKSQKLFGELQQDEKVDVG